MKGLIAAGMVLATVAHGADDKKVGAFKVIPFPPSINQEHTGYLIVAVPDAVARIEEPTLPPDPNAQARDVPRMPARNPTSEPLFDLENSGSAGIRFFGFTLKPGERLTLVLEVLEPRKFRLTLSPPKTPDEMTKEYEKVNRVQAQLNLREITLRNVTGQDYLAVVQLQGEVGHAYCLRVKRA